jgi:hypothetical protein
MGPASGEVVPGPSVPRARRGGVQGSGGEEAKVVALGHGGLLKGHEEGAELVCNGGLSERVWSRACEVRTPEGRGSGVGMMTSLPPSHLGHGRKVLLR